MFQQICNMHISISRGLKHGIKHCLKFDFLLRTPTFSLWSVLQSRLLAFYTWCIVDSIGTCPTLDPLFPESHTPHSPFSLFHRSIFFSCFMKVIKCYFLENVFILSSFFFFFGFCIFMTIPLTYWGSQARSWIGAVADGCTTATATPDLSRVYNLHHSSRQRWILNPLSEARDWTNILMDPSLVR